MVLVAKTILLVWIMFALLLWFSELSGVLNDDDYRKGGPSVLLQVLVGFMILAPIVAIALLTISLWV